MSGVTIQGRCVTLHGRCVTHHGRCDPSRHECDLFLVTLQHKILPRGAIPATWRPSNPLTACRCLKAHATRISSVGAVQGSDNGLDHSAFLGDRGSPIQSTSADSRSSDEERAIRKHRGVRNHHVIQLWRMAGGTRRERKLTGREKSTLGWERQ